MDLTKIFPGTVWDNAYTIDSPIGQGSMAFVYKASVDLSKFDFAHLIAYWEAQKEQVAFDNLDAYCKYRKEVWTTYSPEELLHHCEANNICFPERKICALKISKENNHTERFLAEWQKTIGMYHPHLLQVYGGGKFQDYYYYSMELVDHPYDLKKIYDISINSKVQLILQAAKGLDSLHKIGIVHRDVKIDNFIIFQNNGELHLKIADLGIAKNTDANYTRTNQILGTPNFMAPEQVKNSKSVNELCDIYSLGATLYELICGKPPYDGESLQSILHNINTGTSPIPVNKICEDTPPEINRIIKYLMTFKPSGRPQNMTEVQELLKNYLDGNYTHVAKVRKKTEKVVKKNRRVDVNIKRKRRVEAYKKSANDEKKIKVDMYLKLFVILLGPFLLILYLLFPELITASNKNRGIKKKRIIRETIKSQPIKKRKLTLEETIKRATKKNFIQFKMKELKGKWNKKENRNEWHGFVTPGSKKSASIIVENFPRWDNYEVVFYTRISSGILLLQIEELGREFILNEIFEDLNKYPLIEFKIVVTLLKNDLLIRRSVASSSKITAPKKLHATKSWLGKIIKDPKKDYRLKFVIRSSGKFPCHVSIDQSRIQEVKSE